MKRLHENKIDDAEYYEKIWGEEYNTRPYYDAVRMRALAKFVKSGDKVIDVGAGVFGTCQYLAQEEKRTDLQLLALDQSYTAKEIVDSLNLGIQYSIGEVQKIDFPDKYFDKVIAGEIIEHMEDPKLFVSELCRICKSGGVVSLSTVDTHSENAIKHGDYAEHIWEFEPKELVEFFAPFGKAEYELVGDYHVVYCNVG